MSLTLTLKVANIIQIVLLGTFLIVSALALVGKKIIRETEEISNEKVMFLRLLEDDIVSMKDCVKDSGIQSRLNDLQEVLRYSDPVSHPSLSLLEQKIANKIASMAEEAESGNLAVAGSRCDEIEQMMGERNRKCKILKLR